MLSGQVVASLRRAERLPVQDYRPDKPIPKTRRTAATIAVTRMIWSKLPSPVEDKPQRRLIEIVGELAREGSRVVDYGILEVKPVGDAFLQLGSGVLDEASYSASQRSRVSPRLHVDPFIGERCSAAGQGPIKSNRRALATPTVPIMNAAARPLPVLSFLRP